MKRFFAMSVAAILMAGLTTMFAADAFGQCGGCGTTVGTPMYQSAPMYSSYNGCYTNNYCAPQRRIGRFRSRWASRNCCPTPVYANTCATPATTTYVSTQPVATSDCYTNCAVNTCNPCSNNTCGTYCNNTRRLFARRNCSTCCPTTGMYSSACNTCGTAYGTECGTGCGGCAGCATGGTVIQGTPSPTPDASVQPQAAPPSPDDT